MGRGLSPSPSLRRSLDLTLSSCIGETSGSRPGSNPTAASYSCGTSDKSSLLRLSLFFWQTGRRSPPAPQCCGVCKGRGDGIRWGRPSAAVPSHPALSSGDSQTQDRDGMSSIAPQLHRDS